MHRAAPAIVVEDLRQDGDRPPEDPEDQLRRRDFDAALPDLRDELLGRATFLTKDRAAAEDLVQETLERAWAARCRFRRGTNLRAWLSSIMRNLFVDECRRRSLRNRCDGALLGAPEAPSPELPPSPDEERESPLEVLTPADVVAALATLGPGDREIFTLAHLERVPYRDIAVRLGIPSATAGTRLHRARVKLRQRMQLMYETRLLGRTAGASIVHLRGPG